MAAKEVGFLTDEQMRGLCIPLPCCISVKTGPIDSAVLLQLEKHNFDQAPVYSGENSDHVLGLVETHRLRALFDKGEPLQDDPAVNNERHFFGVGESVPVAELLARMSDRRSVLVVKEPAGSESAYSPWNCGLLTISDLNRQPLRAALYPLLAELESRMAILVERSAYDPWDWLKNLNEEHQVRVLGYWELAKRRQVDVGPVAALTLTQLIQIISKDKSLLSELGYESKSVFEKHTGKIPELRNNVMHPVRPLVLDESYVTKLLATLTNITDLYTRVQSSTQGARRRRH